MSNIILTTTSSFASEGFPKGYEIVHNPFGKQLSESEILELILKYQPVAIVAGVEPLTRAVLSQAKKLKVISRVGIGLDSVDLEAAKEFGIKVLNTPDAPTQAVAEFTIGMILVVLRKIRQLDSAVRRENGKSDAGMLLAGKTVGIVGCGRIGSRVAKICEAIGCKTLGYDPYIKAHGQIKMVELQELIEKSDIVTLHVPRTSETENIISKEKIAEMKKGAVLINISRGGLIDEDALYDALKCGKLYGAALDCFAKEPYSGKLTELDNIVLSSHMGSSTVETRAEMETQAIENLLKEFENLRLI